MIVLEQRVEKDRHRPLERESFQSPVHSMMRWAPSSFSESRFSSYTSFKSSRAISRSSFPWAVRSIVRFHQFFQA